MAIRDVIETANFGALRIGELAEFNEYEITGMRTGHYPQTTVTPTVVSYSEILPRLQNVTTEAAQQWESFSFRSFNSMHDVVTALESPQYHKIVTDIVWIFGAPDVGGLGVMKTGADSYSVVYINGYTRSGDAIVPVMNQLNITHPHGVDISNGTYEGLANIPNGHYDTGIMFVYNYDYDSSTNNINFDGMLRFNADCVFPNAQEGWAHYNEHGQYILDTATFTDAGGNLDNSWQWNFKNDLPTGNIITDAFWAEEKKLQWSLREFYPYWGIIDITIDNVEGTSIFGGESKTIDEEGNPYEVYDPSGGPSGGIGPQDRYSQDTLPEGHPALNLLNSGFVKLYNPTLSEVQQFAHFLFSGITQDMEAVIKRIMVNPIDYILALNMIHIPLTTRSAQDIGFCGISSGVEAPVVTEQYYEIEYELTVKEFWNTSLDYSSYTKCKVYVPYCGLYDVNIDEFQNGTMWLRYVVDVVSGSVIAFLGTKRKQKSGVWLRATLYQFNGNCVLSMPVSQTNWQNVFSSVLNIASMAIAPSPATVGGMANDIMSQKVSVQKSGSISANFGYLGKQQPYIILERPELSIPVDYGHHEGYPANHKRKMSEVHGYTEVKENTLIYNKFSGTDEEMEMLKSVLESGVYLD